jgi:hypothetical protein
MIKSRSFACAAVLIGTTISAHASVLYDNLNLDSATGLSAAVSSWGGENPIAASFSSPGQAVNLTSIVLWMSGDAANEAGAFSVSVVPDAGNPGGASPNLSAPPLAWQVFSDAVLMDFPAPVTLSASAILSPNSRYWVVVDEFPDPLGESAPTSAQWLIAPNDSGFGVAGEYMYAWGSTWATSPTNGAMIMSVDPEAVAEPAALGVLGLGLIGLAALRRRGQPFAA